MSRLTNSLVAAAVLGQLVGLLGWIDVLFIPLLLVAPLLSGAIAASRGVSYAWIAVVWCSAGLCMLWTDWLVNQEDVLFHLATAVVMPLLAGIGWGVARLAGRRLIRA
jgi:hypothetical protein